MIASIVAYDRNRVIGDHGTIPWQGKMKTDARYFRDMTVSHPVIMGRGTYEAMGRALPNRPNIVVSSREIGASDITVVTSLSDAYRVAAGLDDTVFVIGGGQIYDAAMSDIDIIYATEIDAATTGDAYFPRIDRHAWRETARSHHEADEKNVYAYDFVTYERR